MQENNTAMRQPPRVVRQVYRGVSYCTVSGVFDAGVPRRPGTHWCRFSTVTEAKLFDGLPLDASAEAVIRRAGAMRKAVDRALAGNVVWTGDLREPRS